MITIIKTEVKFNGKTFEYEVRLIDSKGNFYVGKANRLSLARDKAWEDLEIYV